MDSPWIILDEREATGSIDTWNEYLCISRTDDPQQFEIAICRYELVAEIPADWFDDDGYPLPQHSDGTGCLVLPEHFDGWAGSTEITGHDGEYLLGQLSFDESYGGPIALTISDKANIFASLNDLEWISKEKSLLVDRIITMATGS